MPQFRTKARALDLLGKGQIADLPTAIAELWKNGYDAYGDNLEAHLFLKGYRNLKDPIFVISDDGMGMSEQDILEKWIVIGTDEKSKIFQDKAKGPDTLFKEPRIKTGEKGIGRLSVSYLGNQMLMITKKIGHPLQVMYLDWRILDNYNLYIEDINIPLSKVENIDQFINVFNNLKENLLKIITKTDKEVNGFNPWEEYELLKKEIIVENTNLQLPDFFNEKVLNSFFNGVEQNQHGTKFVIFKPDSQIIELKEGDKSDDQVPDSILYNISSISGLLNVFKEEKYRKAKCNIKFLVYKSEIPIDIIAQREFFNYEDFKNCDHLIAGKINKFGDFNGIVRIFKKTLRYTFRPNRIPGKTPYGSLKIKIGYIPGRGETTLLDEDNYREFDKKFKRYGGLYIYRDGFRVLPYGRQQNDFLEFEQRRSKSAGYYFFSYRRMFGFIEISRISNKNLRDKSSREGFINNRAYKELREDLISFFYDLARKYYGTNPEFDIKTTQQKEIKEEKLEKEREKKERQDFNKFLNESPGKLDSFNDRIQILNEELKKKITKGDILYREIEEILSEIDKLKIEAEKLKPFEPKRFIATDNQKEKYSRYFTKYKSFHNTTISEYTHLYNSAQEKLKDQELLREYHRKLDIYKNEIIDIINNDSDKLKLAFSNIKKEFELEKNAQLGDFEKKYNQIAPKSFDKNELKQSVDLLNKIFESAKEEVKNKLTPIIEHLNKIRLDIDEDRLVGYYKIEFQKIKEKWEQTQELAQLGIAVEIIDHQFNALYSQLANIIAGLRKYILNNDKAIVYYNLLKTTFEHLENNYKYLTPLYRTTGRIRKDIKGKEIQDYVEGFYSKDLIDNDIKLDSSESFKNASFYTFESIIKPVFINIVNNAIYWLRSSSDKKIYFDYIENKILIMNSGQPIDEVFIKEDIFKLFFSRKPKGRGIGLYLAKTTLNSVGFDLQATNDPKYNKLKGACFIIETKQNQV